MRVTAVVAAYWPERTENVYRIVNDIRFGTICPDRIIIWNNGAKRVLPGPRGHELMNVDEIHAPANYECRGKFVAGLLDASDYYLFMDDDTTVGPKTLECFLHYAHRGCVYGYWGVQLATNPDGSKSFANGTLVGPGLVNAPTRVDAFHGRGMFVAYDALVRMFAAEERVRLETKWKTEGDDLLIGLANEGEIIPMRGDEMFVDLSEEGVAMCHAPGYFEMRDEFLNDALATGQFDTPVR